MCWICEPALATHLRMSAGVEYFLIVGIENSLVGARA